MTIRKVDPRELEAQIIIERVMKFWHKQGYNNTPEIHTRFSKTHEWTSARAIGSWLMRFTIGRSMRDFEHVMLHELCHTARQRDAHGDEFYERLYANCKAYGGKQAVEYMLWREVAYKPRNVKRLAKKHRLTIPAKRPS